MTAPLCTLLAVAVLALVVACPVAHRGRGRHVSRTLARLTRLDRLRVVAVQTTWLVGEAATAVFVGRNIVLLVMIAVLAVWLLDDLLTGGPDDRHRKHEWARVKIRMPKPVKLRPVERVPVPA